MILLSSDELILRLRNTLIDSGRETPYIESVATFAQANERHAQLSRACLCSVLLSLLAAWALEKQVAVVA